MKCIHGISLRKPCRQCQEDQDRQDAWDRQHKEAQQLRQSECQHMPISSEYGTWCELCEKKLSN